MADVSRVTFLFAVAHAVGSLLGFFVLVIVVVVVLFLCFVLVFYPCPLPSTRRWENYQRNGRSRRLSLAPKPLLRLSLWAGPGAGQSS